MATFGERLRELRAKNDIMQKDLAIKLEITPRALRLYESDSREPNLKVIHFLVEYFNVSSDYLLGLTDDPKRY